MEYVNKQVLECTQANINDFINILDKKLIAADTFALINIHTMLKMQSTIGTIISQHSIIQIVGPAVFIASYHIIKNSAAFEAVIKGCLYNQQAALNFKQWNCMFSFLSDEVKESTVAISEIGADLTPEEAYWYYR